ncbi:MAG: SDR family oxidoreductase [Candidatus Scalindua rubra]|uniref:3-oxoacyl carrier protein reductase n=1 Tax=Candidatus Scalindua brodae TaxID=237368 RepID=A0A0B0ESH5_9BACT|nr:MAG: 3-oxoacyl carrier protein reductase [Candidatus Scalindua brodae]MBZ0109655.1 SDR family oxidoreductase [Candidatus Scalindua rubra]TWU33090.1 3-oxoacyl-[acyl-carrier-protein] reductase FabG [Candidatus Brocadiaceae bacterium S225]
MKIDYSNQVVLVTGATRGIGKQIADDFAGLGAKLILTGTNKDQVKILNETSEKTEKGKRKFYCVDFTNAESTEGFIEELKRYEKIDVCVNNAGINKIDYIAEVKTTDWDDVMSVNLRAPFMVIRVVSGIMKRNAYGRIINIASILGVISKEKRSAYSTSKFGIMGMTVAVSNELAKHNVLVNSVSPGFVLTDLTRSILSEKEIEDLATQIPAQRLAGPVDISNVVLFLASSFNTYITGQNIIADGGFVNV